MDSDSVMKYDDVRPVPYRAVRVWLADGTRMLGMWDRRKMVERQGRNHSSQVGA
ncbi:MAG: hypothetical protein ABW214_01420 [Terrimicrobiaceae bacterium]